MPRRPGLLTDGKSAPPERVMEAQRLLGSMRYEQVRMALMERFHVSRTVATRTISLARKLLAMEEEESRPAARATVVARLWRVVDKAEAKDDLRAAVAGLRELTRIYGLAAPIDLKITGLEDQAKFSDLTDQQLDALIALERADAETESGGDLPH
jgi:hypothetical protein